MQILRNHDDKSCTRTIVLDRTALITLHERQTDVWEFDGDGHHALTVKYTGARPVFPRPAPTCGLLEYRMTGLNDGEACWSAPLPLGWESATPPALYAYHNRLYAFYSRPGDHTLMVAILRPDGTWQSPVQCSHLASDYQPALIQDGGALYMAITGLDNKLHILSHTGGSVDLVATLDVVATASPSLVGINRELRVVFRDSSGRIAYWRSADGQHWSAGTGPQSGKATAGGVSAIAAGLQDQWLAHRTSDGKNHITHNQTTIAMPDTWHTPDPPSLATSNYLWLAARGYEGQLYSLRRTLPGSSWTRLPTVNAGAITGEFGLAGHDNSMYVMYRCPN